MKEHYISEMNYRILKIKIVLYIINGLVYLYRFTKHDSPNSTKTPMLLNQNYHLILNNLCIKYVIPLYYKYYNYNYLNCVYKSDLNSNARSLVFYFF